MNGIKKENLDEEVNSKFSSVLSTIISFKHNISMLQNQVRALEKTVKKQVKAYQKQVVKNKSKGNRKPSGFATPMKISDELCTFMKKPKGSEMARTEVTQYIIKYIKDNDLQWKMNRKIIKPDMSLRELLGTKHTDEVTYFNLQRFMNRHFIKKM